MLVPILTVRIVIIDYGADVQAKTYRRRLMQIKSLANTPAKRGSAACPSQRPREVKTNWSLADADSLLLIPGSCGEWCNILCLTSAWKLKSICAVQSKDATLLMRRGIRRELDDQRITPISPAPALKQSLIREKRFSLII